MSDAPTDRTNHDLDTARAHCLTFPKNLFGRCGETDKVSLSLSLTPETFHAQIRENARSKRTWRGFFTKSRSVTWQKALSEGCHRRERRVKSLVSRRTLRYANARGEKENADPRCKTFYEDTRAKPPSYFFPSNIVSIQTQSKCAQRQVSRTSIFCVQFAFFNFSLPRARCWDKKETKKNSFLKRVGKKQRVFCRRFRCNVLQREA